MPACFHCALPVPAHNPPMTEVLGEPRVFCCHGCLAVCRAIVDASLADYYRYREGPSATAEPVPQVFKQLELYDDPHLQQGFVRAQDGLREAALILEDIRCPACLWLNERRLRSLPGVVNVEIDDASQRARVRWDEGRIRLSEILKALGDIGYRAHPYDDAHREALAEQARRRTDERLIFAGLIGMMVMNFSIATYLEGAPDAQGVLPLWVIIGRWTSLIATTAIFAFAGQEFFHGAWQDLKNRRLGMDVPIVLGLVIAYVSSLYATLMQTGEIYFDSVTMFVFFMLLARRAELRGKRLAADALDRLHQVIPRTARKLTPEGEIEVLAMTLKPGDQVRVRPGEAVPVDGVIRAGASRFNESLFTGEALPVERRTGDGVIGGSLNGDQPVEVEVIRANQESTVSEIQRLVMAGLRSRPRYAQWASHAASVFVVVMLLIAAGTALLWGWLDPPQLIPNLISVLIITCPCALALATPVAITLGAARLTALGVLPLRMGALEALAKGEIMAFDKTGTLTEGQARLVRVEAVGEFTQAYLIQIAASLERASEHPFARAFTQAQRDELPVTGLRNHPGQGISGLIAGESWRLGSMAFAGLEEYPLLTAKAQVMAREGYSVIALSNSCGPQALFALQDPLRSDTTRSLRELKDQGIRRIVILSGDHPESVARTARGLPVDAWYGGLSPQDKLAWIKASQAQGQRVVMVGDGFNDAPTLAAADASIALSRASNAAQVASDFVILGESLQVLGAARRVARRTRRIVLQNLAWAAVYNLIAVPLAAAGYVPPWGAALGMSISSLLVVGNSLRLRHRARDVDTAMAPG